MALDSDEEYVGIGEEAPDQESSASFGWVNNRSFFADTIAKYPRQDRKEEQEMIASLPEKEWRSRLVLHNIWFAIAYADNHYRFKRDDKEEIQQRAIVGLVEAAQKFKPDICSSLFRNYAINHIQCQMRDLTHTHLAGAIMYRLTDPILDAPIGNGENSDTMSAFSTFQSSLYLDEEYAACSNLSPAAVNLEIHRAIDFLCEGLRREYARERGLDSLPSKLARHIEVFRLSCLGMDGSQIGKRYNITREGVRQILETMRAMVLLMYEDGNSETDEIGDVLELAYERYLASPDRHASSYYEDKSNAAIQELEEQKRISSDEHRIAKKTHSNTRAHVGVTNWDKFLIKWDTQNSKHRNWHFMSNYGNFYSEQAYARFSVGSASCPR